MIEHLKTLDISLISLLGEEITMREGLVRKEWWNRRVSKMMLDVETHKVNSLLEKFKFDGFVGATSTIG